MIRKLYLMIMSLIINKKQQNRGLYKKNPSRINYKFILCFMLFVVIFVLIVYYVYKTGSLESTGYYYRLNDL